MVVHRHIIWALALGCLYSTSTYICGARAWAQSPQAAKKFAQLESGIASNEPEAAEEDFYALDVPLTLNKTYLGDITAQVTLSGYARISAIELKRILEGRLSEKQNGFLDQFGSEAVLLEELRELGFNISYDPSDLSIKINIARVGVEHLSVSGRTLENVNLDNVEAPADFSAGVGLIARPLYIHKSRNGDTGFAPLSADVRGFVSFGGFKNWSLTYDVNFQEDRESQFQRGDVTLTRDDFNNAIRYQLGDIRPSIIGFQSGLDILGIGIERNYGEIHPFRNLRPGGRSRFILERDARVTYEVNGISLGGERLEAGEYDIRDFPLITGANDVRIIVDDEFGVREVEAYSTFVDSDLLSDNTLLFGLNAGLRRRSHSGGFEPNYDNTPIALGYIEAGVTDGITLGAQFEASETGGFLGGRAIHGFGNNVIALETGVSAFEGADTGIATALRYTNRPFRVLGKTSNQFDAQFSYQSEDFQTLGSDGRTRGEIWSATVRNSIIHGRNSYSMNASWFKSSLDETLGYGLTMRVPYKGISASFGYAGEYSITDDSFDNRVFISLSKNFGHYGSVRSRLSSNPNEAEVEWRRFSARGVGSWSGRASYLSSEIQDEFSADASYIFPRAEIDLGHSTLLENGGGSVISSFTDARIGMGFGFANGGFAIGRPVSNGFFILQRHKTLEDHQINVFQGREQKSGKTDFLGASLIPLTGSYREQTHQVEIENLPPGYDIGSGQVNIFPSYRSGYRVEIGSDPAALVIGVLKNNDDSPVSLVTGRLSRIGDTKPNEEDISFFTNRTGRFVAERVPPGSYELILMPGDRVVKTLTIDDGEDGVFRAGTIVVEAP